jgi:uncharacterized repeat protein (TIGR03803 family)
MRSNTRQHRRCVSGMGQRASTTAVLAVAALLALGMAAPPSAQAQTYSVLYNFGEMPDGANPTGGLIHDAVGNFYGTTSNGGAQSAGTVFEVDLTGKEQVLYYFTGGSDGAYPRGSLVRDAAGNLYGITDSGGAYGRGTIFAVNDSGFAKVLYSFTGGTDGGQPDDGLIRDSAGNFYGTTQGGGAFGYGTVFRLNRAGTETVLYSFTGGADGADPETALTRDGAGNLYGTAAGGGDTSCEAPYGCGTVFKLDPTGTETVLYAFNGAADGAFPASSLLIGASANLYGVTALGGSGTSCGSSLGCGTVFKVDPTGTETVLYSFTGANDGAFPGGALVSDSAGNLYGTTAVGGAHNYGTIFELSPGGVETVLYSFTGEHGGAFPEGGLLRDAAGTLYGTASSGGAADNGVVFKFKP